MNRDTICCLAQKARGEARYPDRRFPPAPYYRFMRLLAEAMQPEMSIELGVCGGGGSLHLALGWPQGTVIGIDVVNSYPGNILHVKRQCPNFRFWCDVDSIEAALLYDYAENKRVDILFIDTVHTYEQTFAEFQIWEPFLAEGAVVLLDDLCAMEKVWLDLPGEKVRLDHLHPEEEQGGGFGAILI